MTLDDLLQTRYKPFGREYPDLDCYGLVRLARHVLYGKPLLPSYAEVDPDDKRRLTACTRDVRMSAHMREVEPLDGAIATAWIGRVCVHIGLVVRGHVLETSPKAGTCWTARRVFERRYRKVIYYAD